MESSEKKNRPETLSAEELKKLERREKYRAAYRKNKEAICARRAEEYRKTKGGAVEPYRPRSNPRTPEEREERTKELARIRHKRLLDSTRPYGEYSSYREYKNAQARKHRAKLRAEKYAGVPEDEIPAKRRVLEVSVRDMTPEQKKEYNREAYVRTREARRIRRANYSDEQKQKESEYQREYRLKNAEKLREYRQDNREKMRQYQAQWRQKNRKKCDEYKRRYGRQGKEETS